MKGQLCVYQLGRGFSEHAPPNEWHWIEKNLSLSKLSGFNWFWIFVTWKGVGTSHLEYLNICGLERGGKGSAAAAVLSLQRQSMFNLKKKTTKKFQLNYFHQINTGQIFNLKDMKLVGLFKCGTGCIIKLPHWTTHWGLDVNLSIDVKTSNSIKLGSVCLEGSMFRQFRIALLLQWIVEALFCSLQWIFVRGELVL